MTPEAFRAFRKSRMWATITHGANYDVHQARLTGGVLDSWSLYAALALLRG